MKFPFALSSRRSQAKPSRRRPVVEPLEARIAPAFTAGPGVGTINGDGNGDTLTIDVGTGADAGKLHHNALGGSFFNDFDWDSATAGEQAILVTGPWSLVVNSGGGDDVISVGSNASPASQLGSQGTITIHGDAHGLGDALTIDNFNDPTPRTITVSATQIILGGGGPTVTHDTFETVAINAGNGDDTFSLTGSATGTVETLQGNGGTDVVSVSTDGSFNLTSNSLTVTATGFNSAVTLSNIETVNLTGGTLANTFTVNGWAGAASLSGLAGADIFNLTLNGTFGATTITGGTESDSLNISGYSLTVADGTADVTVNHTGTGAGNVVLAGLGTVTFSQLEPLTLSGSAADLVINLPSTASTATLGDDGVAANTVSRLSAATFVQTDFKNPTNTLTINRGNSADTLTIDALPDFNASLTIGSAANPFSALTFAGAVTLAANKSLSASATGTINLSTSSSDLTTSGTGAISLTTERDISLPSGSSITTVNGNVTLSANQQVTPTTGTFTGVNMSPGALIQVTGSGNVFVAGKGGDTGSNQFGVAAGGSILGGTTGSLTVQGTGGPSTSFANYGVSIGSAGATISSSGGNVLVIGVGGGTGTSGTNYGVSISNGQVTAGGSGTVTVQGTGGAGSGGNQNGVNVAGSNAMITSNGGTVQVTGQGGGTGASFSSHGVVVAGFGRITAGGNAAVNIQGTGGTGTGFAANHGVFVNGGTVTSGGGNVQVIGQGGTRTAGGDVGVNLASGGLITAGSNGTVNVQGTGGPNATGDHGVGVSASTITSNGGNVQVTGLGGGSAGGTGSNSGIYITASGLLTAGGAGTVTVQGTGGLGTSSNYGVTLVGSSGTPGTISSGGGAVQVTGIGGSGGSSSIGIQMGITGGTFGTISTATNGGNLTVLSNSIALTTDAVISTQAAGTATLKPVTTNTLINLGGADTTGTLGLTTAELNVISTGTLQIGDANSGTITVSAALTPAYNLSLTTGAGVTFNQAITMAVNKSLTASALGTTNGTISLPNSTSILAASGTGAISLTTVRDLVINFGSVVTANGNLNLAANQQAIATSGSFPGVSVTGGGLVQVTGSGNLSIAGKAGAGIGVVVGGLVQGGTTGSLTVQGTGGATGSGNYGVMTTSSSATAITSSGGNVQVIGQGGGSGTASSNYGVYVSGGGITAGGTGTVTVQGTGGAGSGGDHIGVRVLNSTGTITSSGGNVQVTGQGGGTGTAANNHGVSLFGGSVTAGGLGTVTVQGTGGSAGGNSNFGVSVGGGSAITSSGGNIQVIGQGGGTGASFLNKGVDLLNGRISSGGAGTVTVQGTGGAAGASNYGVMVNGSAGIITSAGGNVLVTGQGGGTATSSANIGVWVHGSGLITAGASGTVTVQGTGGLGTGTNYGVTLQGNTAGSPGTITSGGGPVQITGIGGGSSGTLGIAVGTTTSPFATITMAANGGNLTLISDGMSFTTDAIISTQAAGTVTLRPVTAGTLIDLGGADAPGTLGLTNAELNVISTGTLQIGDATSGTVTIGTVISPLNYKTLSIGKGASFTSTGGFASDVTSATVYEKMQVAGALSIDPAAQLTVTAVGGYVPQANQNFTIVENTSASATTGTFLNKPEGSTVPVGGVGRAITYVEGGNDVALLDRFVSVTIGTTPVSESSPSGLIYTFARTGSDTSAALPINFTKGGTATFTNDFTASSTATTFDYNAGTLTIPAGASSVTVTLAAVDDRLVEGSETVSLTVASGTGYGISGTNPLATGTFDDNDTATVALTAPGAVAGENGGLAAALLTLTLNTSGTVGPAQLANAVTVNLSDVGGGTATGGGTDYTFTAPTPVTFNSGSMDGAIQTAAFASIANDQLVEGTETVNLSAAIGSGPATISGNSTLTASINDNDTAAVALSAPVTAAAEAGGLAAAVVTLTLSTNGTGPAQLANAVTVNFTDVGTGTASGSDYTFAGPTAVTFNSGSMSSAMQTASFATIVNDRRVEGTETVDLSAAIASGPATISGNNTITANINDNDVATVRVLAPAANPIEGGLNGAVKLTLTLTTSGTGLSLLDKDITVDVSDVGGGTAIAGTDYTFVSPTTVTFSAGSSTNTSATANFFSFEDDQLVEEPETVNFSAAITSGPATIFGSNTITTSINDNDTATVTLSAPGTLAAEGGGTAAALLTLTLNTIGTGPALLTKAVTVNVTDLGTGTAAATDYTFTNPTVVTFAPNSIDGATQTANFASITNDQLVEGTETVDLTAVIASGPAMIPVENATLTASITDNDTATWSLTGSSGATEGTNASYTISLAGILLAGATATINVALSDSTTSPADYGALTAAINAAIGARTDLVFNGTTLTYTGNGSAMPSLTFALAATDDSLVEGDESFSVVLSGPGSTTGTAVAGAASVATTITDNDTATWSLIGSSSASEGTNASYTLSLAGLLQSAETATINVGLSDSTTLAADHAALAAAITAAIGSRTDLSFNAGTLTYTGNGSAMSAFTFNIGATDDTLVEGDESFSVAISSPGSTTGAAVAGTGSVSTTITDNDTASWSLTGTNGVSEGFNASYTLSLAGTLQSAETATINLALTDSTTVAADHGALAAAITAAIGSRTDLSFNAGTLTYTGNGSAMPALTFNIAATDDTLAEGDESFTVALASPGSTTGAAVTGTGSVSTTILDNDVVTWSLIGSSSASEGAADASYTLSLAGTLQTAETATINVALNDGTTLAADYGALAAAITTAIGSRTDLSFNAGTLTYTGNGSTMQALTFTIGATDDSLVEGDESFAVAISSPSSTTGAAVNGTGSVSTTISDNDSATWSLIGSSSAVEGADASYTLSLAGILQSAETATINVALSDNTTLAADHGALAAAITAAIGSRTDLSFNAGTLTYTSNGSAMTAFTFNIAATDDSLVEQDESFSVAISSPGSTTGAAVTGTGSVSTTITDNDIATWSLTGSSSATEGTNASYTISLANVLQSAQTATINVALSDSTAVAADHGALAAAITAAVASRPDLAFNAGTLTYTSDGSAMTPLTFNIGLTDDTLVEGGESFSVALASPGSTTGAAVAGTGSVTTTITDNDTARIGFASAASAIAEGAGDDSLGLVLTIVANGIGTPRLAHDVTFNVVTTGGTATGGGTDYTLPALVTFAADSLNGATRTANLAITNDAIVEYSETAILGLAIVTNEAGGQVTIATGTAASHTTTITDNDTATVTLSGGVALNEGQSGTTAFTFTATLDHAVQGGFSVPYTTNDGTATLADHDYTDNDGTLTFAGNAGEQQTITVLASGDTKFEIDEAFTVALGALNSPPASVIVAGSPQTGTIQNDDAAPTISIADTGVLEGDAGFSNAVFTVTLSNASYLPVTVDYATANGTAIAPGDYTAAHASLTFAPDETSKMVNVAVRGETLYENGADETFLVNVTNPSNATLGDPQAVGTITHDDAAPANAIPLNATHSFTFLDENNDKVVVKLTGPGNGTLILNGGVLTGADISEINLAGTTTTSALSIAVTKNLTTGDGFVGLGEVTVDGSLLSFSAKAADLEVGGFRASGGVKTITAHALKAGEIMTGAGTSKLALTVGGAIGVAGDPFLIETAQVISSLKAARINSGAISALAFDAINVTAGPLAADITSVGAIAKITVKGGGLSGDITARSFGPVSITGGDFSGTLTSLTPAATLDKIAALKSLTITDGDLTGDVRVLGTAGAISVKGKALGVGGNILGATIVASQIASLTVAKNFTSSVVLAGADLGADYALGGGDDSFASGSIGTVKITGKVSGASVIGAGLKSTNDIFKDGDDTILGGIASVIKSFTITGTADHDSYFAAGLFKTTPKIAGAPVVFPDDRFKVG